MSSLKKRSEQGFTIVELLIVIVVIGILAALVITTYNGIQQRGRNTDRQNDLNALKSHLETYQTLNGHYPSTTDLGSTSASNLTFIAANMKGLDKEALRDPLGTASDYSLVTTSTAKKYAYKPTDDSGANCDNTTNDCTKYTLTAKQEGNTTDIVVNSLN